MPQMSVADELHLQRSGLHFGVCSCVDVCVQAIISWRSMDVLSVCPHLSLRLQLLSPKWPAGAVPVIWALRRVNICHKAPVHLAGSCQMDVTAAMKTEKGDGLPLLDRVSTPWPLQLRLKTTDHLLLPLLLHLHHSHPSSTDNSCKLKLTQINMLLQSNWICQARASWINMKLPSSLLPH